MRNTKEYWDNHEYVREYASKDGWRLIKILDTQWKEDYFKSEPYAVRHNSGENWDTFKTFEEAKKVFDSIEKHYAA